MMTFAHHMDDLFGPRIPYRKVIHMMTFSFSPL